MPYTTQIQDIQGNNCPYTISEHPYGTRTLVVIDIDDKRVGSMEFSTSPDYPHSLYIHRMNNYSKDWAKPFKHVGSVLFEHAFRTSIALGFNGRIDLQSVDNSSSAFVLMGFRSRSYAANLMRNVLYLYFKNPSKENELKITQHEKYSDLRLEAANNVKKNLRDISFEEAIQYGLYDEQVHNNFEEKLKTAKGGGQKINFPDPGMGGMMFLPEAIIAKLKLKLMIEVPLESNATAPIPPAFNSFQKTYF